MSLPVPAIDDTTTDLAAEIGGDLQRSLAQFMDHAVREWRTMLAQLDAKPRPWVAAGGRDDAADLIDFTRAAVTAFERMGREGAGKIDHLSPAELGWYDLSAETARDDAAGSALWERVKQAARDDLACGRTGGVAIAGHQERPMGRAAYLAIRGALAGGLQPRNGMEWLLVDGMAEAWTMYLRWLKRHADTDSLEAYRVERDARARGEWQPPRMGDAEAVDRAALMADRFQRQFLRLMRAYRDQRRLLGAVVVAAGGQLNVAERQLNLCGSGADDDG